MNEHLSHNPDDCEGRKAKSENEQSVLSGRRYRRHLGVTTFAVESAWVGGLWEEYWKSDGSGPLPMRFCRLSPPFPIRFYDKKKKSEFRKLYDLTKPCPPPSLRGSKPLYVSKVLSGPSNLKSKRNKMHKMGLPRRKGCTGQWRSMAFGSSSTHLNSRSRRESLNLMSRQNMQPEVL